MPESCVICKYSGCKYDEIIERVRVAELERDQYRDALDDLANHYGSPDQLYHDDQYQAAGMVEAAKKALRPVVSR